MNLIGGPSQLQLYQQLSHHDFRQLVTHECCNSYFIKRELGETVTGCLFQLTYFVDCFMKILSVSFMLFYEQYLTTTSPDSNLN